jgi:hypothetical protein
MLAKHEVRRNHDRAIEADRGHQPVEMLRTAKAAMGLFEAGEWLFEVHSLLPRTLYMRPHGITSYDCRI